MSSQNISSAKCGLSRCGLFMMSLRQAMSGTSGCLLASHGNVSEVCQLQSIHADMDNDVVNAMQGEVL